MVYGWQIEAGLLYFVNGSLVQFTVLFETMDSMTCLAVAGAAVHFLDFGLSLISRGLNLYESGQLSVHVEAEKATKDLFSFTTNLERSLYPSGIVPSFAAENELALQKLCEECSVAAKELMVKLSLLVSEPFLMLGSL